MVRKACKIHGKLPGGGHKLNSPSKTQQKLAAHELDKHWTNGIYDSTNRYFNDTSQESSLNPLLFEHRFNLAG